MLRLAGAAAVTFAGERAFTKLDEGVILNEYPLSVQDKRIGDIEEISSEIFGPDGGVLSKSEGNLLFEPNPNERFFVPGNKYAYVHRANRATSIRKAHQEGADLIDIDINNERGSLFAEHGLVPQVELKLGRRAIKFHLPMVVDVNERGFTLGAPNHRYRDAVKLMAELGGEGRRLAVSAELKRGEFGPEELYEILQIHQEYFVPIMMHSPDSERLSLAGDELASYYDTAR